VDSVSELLDARRRKTRTLLWILIPLVLAMFGFAFAQVPLFKSFCQVIGFAQSPNATNAKSGGTGREVSVLFTGVSAGKLPVYFKPKRAIQKVRVGQRFDNEYKFVNMSGDSVFFRPIHSVLPEDAAKKFTMLKCFCFNDQAMGPHEEKTFPVIYMLSSDLDSSVQQVSLNYTLFAKTREQMDYTNKEPAVADTSETIRK
jgi:cytochrome c oxidase assembly protein subunit 11